jgi:hypothetical protein
MHFSTHALTLLSSFSTTNPFGLVASPDPQDPSIASVCGPEGLAWLAIKPVSEGFEVRFEDASSYDLSGNLLANLIAWPNWVETFPTLGAALACVEDFMGAALAAVAALQAILDRRATAAEIGAGLLPA